MKRIYMVTVSRQSNESNSLLDVEVCDTLESALEYGKIIIRNNCYNRSNIDLDTEEDYINYLNRIKKEHDIEYIILISEISTNRKRFNTSKELMDYFNTNIKNISNDNLYDFLLSLVDSITVLYDYFGNILYTHIDDASPIEENVYYSKIDFNEEDCKKGIYTFEYR